MLHAPSTQNLESDRGSSAQDEKRWEDIGRCNHFVHFYESDHFLEQAVAKFVCACLKQDEAGIIIATASHRRGIEAKILEKGFDVTRLKKLQRLYVFDA